jgi:phosphatidylglycerophosphatase A
MNTYDQGLIETITLFLMPFLLFRIFDIIKPWPIGWVDKNIKGGFGIMIDDILAAILASIMQYALLFVFV